MVVDNPGERRDLEGGHNGREFTGSRGETGERWVNPEGLWQFESDSGWVYDHFNLNRANVKG